MVRQTKRPGRVHGPYAYRREWRIVVVDAEGNRNHRYFKTEEDARQVVRSLKRLFRAAAGKPLRDALDAYELYMRYDKRNKLNSVLTTRYRLDLFFEGFNRTLEDLGQAECARRYERLRMHQGRRGKPISDDCQLNILAETKTFFRWCVKQKWLKSNPLEAVEGKGRRRHGKPQLRIDEARKWLAMAVWLAYNAEKEREREGALKAIMTLAMGLREHEVLQREVRDVDDGGTLLWIPDSKTPAGKRTQEVPAFLVSLLVEQAKGRPGTEPLFRHRCKGVGRRWVERICHRAGVMKVNAQSMRGLHATLAVARGVTSHAVAAALGHESFATTARSYAKVEAVTAAAQSRAISVLTGGNSAAFHNDEGAQKHEKLHNQLCNLPKTPPISPEGDSSK